MMKIFHNSTPHKPKWCSSWTPMVDPILQQSFVVELKEKERWKYFTSTRHTQGYYALNPRGKGGSSTSGSCEGQCSAELTEAVQHRPAAYRLSSFSMGVCFKGQVKAAVYCMYFWGKGKGRNMLLQDYMNRWCFQLWGDLCAEKKMDWTQQSGLCGTGDSKETDKQTYLKSVHNSVSVWNFLWKYELLCRLLQHRHIRR